MRTARVGDLATQLRGVTFAKSDASNEPRDGTIGVVRAGNIVDGELLTDDLVFVPASKVNSKQLLRQHDVLIAASSGSLEVVGKAARVRDDQRVAFGAFCKVLRPSARVDPGYFSHYFQTSEYRRHVSSVAAGANINNLKNSDLDDIEIPLPPIEEQRRIAAVLDAANALRAKRRQALAKLDTLTQAIFIDMFGDPLHPSKGLRHSRLGDIAAFVRGVTFKPSDVLSEPESGSVQVMRTANVQSKLDTNDVWHIAGRFVKRDDQLLLPLDTLISSANSWNLVGRCCLIPTDLPRSTFGGFVTVLRVVDHRLTPRYLHAWFSSAKVQRTVRSFGRRTTNISNLDLAQCSDLTIAVPTSRELEAFELALARLEHEKSQGERAIASLDGLFASLQQRAFRGDL